MAVAHCSTYIHLLGTWLSWCKIHDLPHFQEVKHPSVRADRTESQALSWRLPQGGQVWSGNVTICDHVTTQQCTHCLSSKAGGWLSISDGFPGQNLLQMWFIAGPAKKQHRHWNTTRHPQFGDGPQPVLKEIQRMRRPYQVIPRYREGLWDSSFFRFFNLW